MVIVPAPEVKIPVWCPAGIRATRCTTCGTVALHVPGDLRDEWKHHFDYFIGADDRDQDQEDI